MILSSRGRSSGRMQQDTQCSNMTQQLDDLQVSQAYLQQNGINASCYVQLRKCKRALRPCTGLERFCQNDLVESIWGFSIKNTRLPVSTCSRSVLVFLGTMKTQIQDSKQTQIVSILRDGNQAKQHSYELYSRCGTLSFSERKCQILQ